MSREDFCLLDPTQPTDLGMSLTGLGHVVPITLFQFFCTDWNLCNRKGIETLLTTPQPSIYAMIDDNGTIRGN